MSTSLPCRFMAAAMLCATSLVAGDGVIAVGDTQLDWPVYRGDPKGNQYAPLAQIHAANVHTLQPCLGIPHRRCEPAFDDVRQPDRGQRRDVRDDAELEGGGA